MESNREVRDNTIIYNLKGSLNTFTIKDVRDQIKQDATDSSVETLILNLTEVTLLDSAALGFMVQRFRDVRERQAIMRICGLNYALNDLFEMTRLNRMIPIHATLEEALNPSE